MIKYLEKLKKNLIEYLEKLKKNLIEYLEKLKKCLKDVGYSATLRDVNRREFRRHRCSFIAAFIILIFIPAMMAWISYCMISLTWWICQVDNLVVILGIALAATSLRSARPFPITDPCHFDRKQQIDRLESQILSAKRSIYWAGGLAGGLLFFVVILPSIQGSSLTNNSPRTISAIIGVIMSMTVIVIPIWYAFVDYYMTKQTVQGIRRAFRNRPQK